MIADVIGAPIGIPAGVEFGAKGAALIASVGIGQFASIAEACRESFELEQRYEPNGALCDDYAAAYARYRAATVGGPDLIPPSCR
jgi:sugar (pentulose or hexulose) kinase